MEIFVKECGYDAGLHDNQTMWFEQTAARSHYANGKFREALKELWHVQMHSEHMI